MDDHDGDSAHDSGAESERPDGEVPAWWEENVEIREELGLGGYDAPRFEDGRYVHEVLEELEAEHDGQIRLVDPEPSTGRGWEVRLDGEPVATVQRTRDANANTVFGMRAAAFREAIRTARTDDD